MSNDQPTNREILNAIEKLTEKLTELATPRKPTRQIALKMPVTSDLRESRRETLLRVFYRFAKYAYMQRREYKFPKCLRETRLDVPQKEAMPRSILVNQCSLRKAFRKCEGEESSTQNVLDTLKEMQTSLVVAQLNETVPALAESNTLCVFSISEAEKLGLLEMPEEIDWNAREKEEKEEREHFPAVDAEPVSRLVWPDEVVVAPKKKLL